MGALLSRHGKTLVKSYCRPCGRLQYLFGTYLLDGLLDTADRVTIYVSAKDKSLGMSEWVFRRERLGQMVSEGLSREALRFLQQHQNLVIVDATDAPGADTGNGHAYFRKSPWTSSDILATLMFDFEPG